MSKTERLERWLSFLDMHYGVWYYLPRPWLIVSRQIDRAREFWQRGRRGFSDVDCWNLDAHLDRILADALPMLAGGWGYPVTHTPERWESELREAAAAFRLSLESDDWQQGKAESERIERARLWVAEHWGHLWD